MTRWPNDMSRLVARSIGTGTQKPTEARRNLEYWTNDFATLYHADAREIPLPDRSVHCVVTSPPYYNLRRYETDLSNVIGNESSPDEYVKSMLDAFREVKRVLRDDGICWVNLGDSYAVGAKGGIQTQEDDNSTNWYRRNRGQRTQHDEVGIAHGNMIGIPWRFAFAMQSDGWTLRDAVIWAKSAPMPESVNGTRWEQCRIKTALSPAPTTQGHRPGDGIDEWVGGSMGNGNHRSEWMDCPGCEKCNANDGLVLRKGSWRSTASYEFIYQFTKGMGYYADGEAVKTDTDANRRNVWKDINAENYNGEHYATFPPDLPRICIQASTSEAGVCSECGDQWARVMTGGFRPSCDCNGGKIPATVLDPFNGSGTTLIAAQRLGRRGVGVDISTEYLAQSIKRISRETLPMMIH